MVFEAILWMAADKPSDLTGTTAAEHSHGFVRPRDARVPAASSSVFPDNTV